MQHGRNPASDARKRHVVSLLQVRLGILERKFSNRPDWYLSDGDNVEVFITDSKPHCERRPWFDMSVADIKALAGHSCGFIIFVLGYKDNFLVIPAKDLMAHLPEYRDNQTQNGRYHLNLNKKRTEFEQFPGWSLYPYADKLELIPNGIS
ncbi:MAG TPA: hypothetical protein VIK35_00145 [Verrucomicrobiae bacterium]